MKELSEWQCLHFSTPMSVNISQKNRIQQLCTVHNSCQDVTAVVSAGYFSQIPAMGAIRAKVQVTNFILSVIHLCCKIAHVFIISVNIVDGSENSFQTKKYNSYSLYWCYDLLSHVFLTFCFQQMRKPLIWLWLWFDVFALGTCPKALSHSQQTFDLF